MNISQYPNADQIAALLGSQETGPVVMVNLLKFKDRADAPDAGLSRTLACERSACTARPVSKVSG